MWYKILNLRAVRIVALVVGIYICIQTGRNLVFLWGARARVTDAEEALRKLQLKNKVLEDQTKEIGTPEFAERQAREKLGLVKEGEVIFVLPPGEVQRLAKSLREEYFPQNQGSEELANWQKWWQYFFG